MIFTYATNDIDDRDNINVMDNRNIMSWNEYILNSKLIGIFILCLLEASGSLRYDPTSYDPIPMKKYD